MKTYNAGLAGYHQFVDEQGYSHGSFEVFHKGAHCDEHESGAIDCHDCAMNSGWYWWSCFPGCLPDGDPVGPFESAEDAFKDARGDV